MNNYHKLRVSLELKSSKNMMKKKMKRKKPKQRPLQSKTVKKEIWRLKRKRWNQIE